MFPVFAEITSLDTYFQFLIIKFHQPGSDTIYQETGLVRRSFEITLSVDVSASHLLSFNIYIAREEWGLSVDFHVSFVFQLGVNSFEINCCNFKCLAFAIWLPLHE